MTCFDKNIFFRKSWRPYQQRVLSDLQSHLADGHLHIVAAPGSGKTILGLEVVRRLDKPALIFSPTLTIRDQWAQRFKSLFCPEGYDAAPMISTHLDQPALLTLSTYQGLHTALTGERTTDDADDEDDELTETDEAPAVGTQQIIDRLKAAQIGTIVIDEAHHLRNEWWKCLLELKTQLDRPTIVALTATPPYDVEPHEWSRYEQMCGPIDAEITVPELVSRKNLCPHQDYVYFSSPTLHELKSLVTFRTNARRLCHQLLQDQAFADTLASLAVLRRPEDRLEEILDDPAFFSAILIFLWQTRRRAYRPLMQILGTARSRIPKMDYEWMETLLTGCLYRHKDLFPNGCGLSDETVTLLKRGGLIEHRRVQFRSNAAVRKLLTFSSSKLRSIRQVVALETKNLGQALRMVILTDYIRAADLPKNAHDLRAIRRLGVVGIFETLRRKLPDSRLAVLSGRLIILPNDAAQPLLDILKAAGAPAPTIAPLACDDRYIAITSGISGKIVDAVTTLFSGGRFNVLVGTRSLLGEGWDAPCINALVLASFVGSYMLSNQMRGRAIRVQDGSPHKTANIWHLVCTDAEDISDDYLTLCRRFRAYVGISFKDTSIQNGIDRLRIGQPPFSKLQQKLINRRMQAWAADRDGMRQRWIDALAANETGQMVEEIRTPAELVPRRLILFRTLRALVYQGIFLASTIAAQIEIRTGGDSPLVPLIGLCVVSGVFALAALPFLLRAAWLFIKHGPVEFCLAQIGRAVLDTLIYAGDIQTPPDKMGVKTVRLDEGAMACTLAGATTYERNLFIEALQELIDPIENPRYVIVRRSPLLFFRRTDFHAVPARFAKRKETAEFFLNRWRKHVGASELIFTRSLDGRRLLVKARGQSLSQGLRKRTERLNRWQ